MEQEIHAIIWASAFCVDKTSFPRPGQIYRTDVTCKEDKLRGIMWKRIFVHINPISHSGSQLQLHSECKLTIQRMCIKAAKLILINMA